MFANFSNIERDLRPLTFASPIHRVVVGQCSDACAAPSQWLTPRCVCASSSIVGLRARCCRWGWLFLVKVGCIFQECDPLLDDPLERLVILPVSRNPLTVQSEARQGRAGAAPLERAFAVVVVSIILN